MINSYEELEDFLLTIDLGPTTFTVDVSSFEVDLRSSVFVGKKALSASDYWLDSVINAAIQRYFDPTNKKWMLNSNLSGINSSINGYLLDAISKCVDSKVPERTSIYKDFVHIFSRYHNDKAYLSSIIQILNYYNESKTDSTCKKNTLAILEVLRKRYNGKSN